MRASTRLRVSAPTSAHPRTTFETVITDTFRSWAMSFRRTGAVGRLRMGTGHVPEKASIAGLGAPAGRGAATGGVFIDSRSERVYISIATDMGPERFLPLKAYWFHV